MVIQRHWRNRRQNKPGETRFLFHQVHRRASPVAMLRQLDRSEQC